MFASIKSALDQLGVAVDEFEVPKMQLITGAFNGWAAIGGRLIEIGAAGNF